MSDTVLSELQGKRGRLADRLIENKELCNVVMGLLTRILYCCQTEMKKPIQGVTISEFEVNDNTFKCRVSFCEVPIARTLLMLPKRDFEDYLGQRSTSLAMALRVNQNLATHFERLVESLVQYADFNGIPFGALVFNKHIITPDWLVILEVGRRAAI